MQATEFVGLPECQLALSQAVTYIATAPKSNAATMAIAKAREDVAQGRTLAVPDHLRDSHSASAAERGKHADYQYSHDHEGGWVDQEYLGAERTYYEPTDRGFEAVIKQRMDELKKRKQD